MKITDLEGIDPEKLKEAVRCLDTLLTNKDQFGRFSPIITGYNWYDTTRATDPSLTLYHIHETEKYKKAMFRDLKEFGYSQEELNNSIRTKAGVFLWKPKFEIRDDKGKLYTGLTIRDTICGQYLDLENYEKPLINYPTTLNVAALVAEDQGWELNLQFRNDDSLISLVDMFTIKSGRYIHSEDGYASEETAEEKCERSFWPGAYETPVLLVGKGAIEFEDDLPQLVRVTRIALVENSNEISFVVNKNRDRLKTTEEYFKLIRLEFKEEPCLANKPFIIEYVDKDR